MSTSPYIHSVPLTMESNKPSDTTSSSHTTAPPSYNPPSYEMHSRPADDLTPSDEPIITELIIDPNTFPPYTALRLKYRVSLAINLIIILVILPIIFVGLSMINSQTCTNSNSSNNGPFNTTGFGDTTPFITARADTPPLFCVTSFTKDDLD